MRLWHKDLICVLPQKQLVSQWRECCAIARNIAVNGSPNHILVNKVMDYPMEEFWIYARLVFQEMKNRGYSCDFSRFSKWLPDISVADDKAGEVNIFAGWHTERYLWQCYANLEEKYDCGGIPDDEFLKVQTRMIGQAERR